MNEEFYGWCLGLGFVLIGGTILLVALGVAGGHLESINPFAPFIRAFERWQQHHHRMKELELRAKMIHAGIDEEYVTFMEKKVTEEEK